MKRRDFISCIPGVALGANLPANAQTQRVARVGILANQPPSSATVAPVWRAFYGELQARGNLGSALAVKDMQVSARDLGLMLVSLPVDLPAELEPALLRAQRESVQALHVHPTPVIGALWRQISAWAMERQVVTISGFDGFTRGGFLVSYGAEFAAVWRIAATFVDRILRGAKAADLPVEQPTKFELIINTRTAKALGLTIPQSLLLRADQLVE